MIKKAGVVVVLAGVSWWGATAYTGRSFERGYEAQLAEAQKKYAFLKLSDLQKRTSLTGGTYSGKIQLGCAMPAAGASAPAQPLVLTFEHEVKYGPFPGFKRFGAAHVNTRLSAAEGFKLEGLQSLYGYAGGFESRWRMPAGSYATPGAEGTLSWADSDVEVSGKRDGSQLRYRWTSPEFAMSFAGKGEPAVGAGEFRLKGLVLDGESTGQNAWMRPGTQNLALEHFELKSVDAAGRSSGMLMDKLAVKGASTVTNNLMDMQASYTVGKISVPAGVGPAVELANMDMQVSLKRLEVAGLEAAMTELVNSLSQSCEGGAAQDPQAQRLALMKGIEQFGKAGKAVLLHDPSYAIDKFAVDFAGKRGEMSAQFAIQGLKQADLDGPPEALNARLMQVVSATAKGRMPMEWLAFAASSRGVPAEQAKEQANLMAASIVQNGMALREGEFLSSSFSFAKGVAQVNGKPVWQMPVQPPQ